MVERIRLFRGATELSYGKAQVVKSDDYVVDHTFLDIEADSNVTIGSVIDVKKADGSTNVFSAKVQEIKKESLWRMECFTNGFELFGLRVENVYENESPEDIVSDVIGRTTNLTYISTQTSGRTITKYVAKGFAIDIIKDMMDVLDWQITIDTSDQVDFGPKGFIDNGNTLTNGVNFNIKEWITDKRSMFNVVRVIGGFESNFTTGETVVGTGTEFTLAHKPKSTVRAVVSGSEVDNTTYKVDAEQKLVTFDSSVTDPVFDYAFQTPVIVTNQDDSSVNTYDEIFQEVPAPWLNRISDARLYSQQLLDVFSTPLLRAVGFEPGLNFDREIGEIITVIDNVRGISEKLVVTRIVLDAISQQTKLEFGDREYLLYEWQRDVETRIKKLEQRATNEDAQVFARLEKSTMKISFEVSNTWEYNSPVDSFILGHPTLGRMRIDLNYEADCSDNGLIGTWQGSSISGSQYTTSGYRLSAGSFNGTDNYIDVTGSISGLQCVSCFVKLDTLNRDLIKLSSTAKITINSSGLITTTGLSNVSYYVNTTLSGTITTGTWYLVTVLFDSMTANDIEIGRSVTYTDGLIDEVTMYSRQITTAEMTLLINKNIYDTSNTFKIPNLEGYWSMDNPKLGSRFTSRITIT